MAAEPARIAPEVARQAAHWHMLMLDPGTNPAQREACARWRAAAPEHERAWQKAQRVQARLGLLPPQLAMGTLNRERRQVLKQLLVLALVAPAGYVGYRQVAPAGDYRTAIGERRRLELADGTVLQLNTHTVVDVDFDEHQRLITLRRGEILVDSGKDPHRPLRVASDQGLMEALGTRFLVRQREGRTQLSVFEGAVLVTPTNQRVDAGQQLLFDGKNPSTTTPAREQDSQWTRGQLIVEEMPLRDFLGELGRYRSGWLRCQDEVAPLLISGAFQLDNTDAILAALPATLPVRVGYRTRYWVTITPR
ncbi:FecR domain-containing protein [Pseudomonas sp. 148P]|uniref:FecR domain-containing protein n=1 Tax=Pseudomonas ulcerans TaxID=3115852 RepID=A0ABU7HRR8_9PSED|nr:MULTISPECIES: FecR domain-containing protein [unclassified Pseudomonas]MEE1923221.1 FecR domain-containing protein [Pseudomonas sp. 147P]MEE1934183.1 FecR domain-containing protein [Pseudomonas sp. 148P]